MADTRIDIIQSNGGRINVVSGRTGTGTSGRQVTVEAIPDPGFTFDRWVVVKTLPLYATVAGPYTEEQILGICEQSYTQNINSTTNLYISSTQQLFTTNSGTTEAPFGWYFVVSGPELRYQQYFQYGPDILLFPTTCPAPNGDDTGGRGGDGLRNPDLTLA